MKKNYSKLLLTLGLVSTTYMLQAQGVINSGARIVVGGGTSLVITGGGFTNSNSGLVDNDGDIYVDGNWTNNASNGVFSSLNASGAVLLNGNSAQSIGGSNATTFENLTVSGTGTKTLNVNNTSVGSTSGGVLTVSGKISLNSNTLIIDNNSVAGIQQNSPFSTNHIMAETSNGLSKIQWNIRNAPVSNSYRFPFGNAAGDDVAFTYQVTTSGTQSTVGNITVTTYPTGTNNLPKPPTMPSPSSPTYLNFEDNGPPSGDGTAAAVDRWWTVDANNYSVLPVSTQTFKYSDTDLNISGNTLLAEVNIQAQIWDPTASGGTGGWRGPDYFGGSNASVTANNEVVVTNVNKSAPWVLHDGQSGGNSPLPISLVSFNATCNDDVVNLSWITATEVNNDYFEVQRSTNGINYTTIGVVDGAGNSNSALTYTFVDNSPVITGAYYRLNQVDFNGQNEAFAPKFTRCGDVTSNTVTLFPNPAGDQTNIGVNLTGADYGAILVYNAVGQLISSTDQNFGKGMNIINLNTTDLAQGQYFIHIQLQNAQLPVQKLVVSR